MLAQNFTNMIGVVINTEDLVYEFDNILKEWEKSIILKRSITDVEYIPFMEKDEKIKSIMLVLFKDHTLAVLIDTDRALYTASKNEKEGFEFINVMTTLSPDFKMWFDGMVNEWFDDIVKGVT